MSNEYIPIVPKSRLLEIIRGYVSSHSASTTRPDMNSERRLLELCETIVDEAQARLHLWELERKAKS